MSIRFYLLLILTVASVLTLPWIGDKPFYTRGEPREAIVAQDMLQTGNWILPAGYGVDVPSKPPLLHWFMAVLSTVAGEISEFTCRLPSALASIIFAGVMFLFLQKRTNSHTAAIATLILLTTSEWSRAALASRVDMILAASTAAGLLAIFSWSEREYRGFPILAVFLLSGATLAKGPVSIVLPGAVLCIHGYLKGVSISRLAVASVKLFLPVTGIAALWYLAAYLQEGEKFYQMVKDENFNRFAGTMEETPHKHSVVFHPLMLLVGLLPWSLIAFPSLIGLRKQAVRWWKGQSSFDRYCAIVSIIFLVFYSIPASKRSVYLLPIYPFLAVLLASFFSSSLSTTVKISGWLFGVLGVLYSVFLFALCGPESLMRSLLSLLRKPEEAIYFLDAARKGFLESTPLELVVLSLPIIALILFFWRGALRGLGQTGRSLCVVGAFICALNGPPARWIAESVSSKPFSFVVAAYVPPEATLYSFGTEFYGIAYYTGRRIYSVESPLPVGAFVLLNESDLPEFRRTLSPRQEVSEISRSTGGITKPSNIVVLGQITESQ